MMKKGLSYRHRSVRRAIPSGFLNRESEVRILPGALLNYLQIAKKWRTSVFRRHSTTPMQKYPRNPETHGVVNLERRDLIPPEASHELPLDGVPGSSLSNFLELP